jgi:hypothetical protein
MNISRRKLLTSSALGVGALTLANCTTAQIASVQTSFTDVVGQIQNAVATATAAISTASAYIPTVESIISTAASLFGPQYSALVTAGSAAFNQIVATLTNVISTLSPPASAKLGARLRASSPQLPVTIGTTSTGVKVTGWKA